MTLSPEALQVLLASAALLGMGALSVVVLPWSDEEVAESWAAWSLLARAVRRSVARLRAISQPSVTDGALRTIP